MPAKRGELGVRSPQASEFWLTPNFRHVHAAARFAVFIARERLNELRRTARDRRTACSQPGAREAEVQNQPLQPL
eukprot:scaffold648046_cov45-Prasinocladus_malaysianus.AAC.1